MDKIKKSDLIAVDPNSLERSKNGAITGVIYFNFDHYKFPEIGWNDFVVVILGWWLEAIKRFTRRMTETEDLRFMDGQLRVRITNNDEETCMIECIDDGRGSVVEYSTIILIEDLLSAAIHVGNSILGICEANTWDSDDINILKKLTEM
jgi:hypothetical protein